MSEPKMVGCGHAFEYMSDGLALGSNFGPRDLEEWMNRLGAKGWEVMFIHNNRIYLKRKIPTAYELKMIEEAEAATKALKETLEGLLAGGSDGEPTH